MSETFVSKEEFEAFAHRTRELGNEIKSLIRSPSMAGVIGAGSSPSWEPQSGEFIAAILDMAGNDPQAYNAARNTLETMGGREDAWGKAALGTSDATGGWIIPNAQVEGIVKPGLARNPYRSLMTVRPGVTSAAVDLPFRAAAPGRALIALAGAAKENVDLPYNGYTATMAQA